MNRPHLKTVLAITASVLGVLLSLGLQPVTAEPGEAGAGSPDPTASQKNNTYSTTELMPLQNRQGFYHLYLQGQKHPQALPFDLQKSGENKWVLTKQDRVKHHLVHTEEGAIAIRAETDLKESRHITYDPPVPLLLEDVHPGDERSGQSTVQLHDPASGPVSDSGSCTWTLTFEGQQSGVNTYSGTYEPYRFRLVRHISLGTFKKATLTTVFDFVPGLGQVRVQVKHDARVLGLIGPNEDWRIERGEWIDPQYATSPLLRETTSLYLGRYDRARDALARGKPGHARRALKQIKRGIDRMDLSITNLSDAKTSQVGSLMSEFEGTLDQAIGMEQLERLRNQFKEVSRTLRNLLAFLGHNGPEPVRVYQCTTAPDSDRRWLGSAQDTECPYDPDQTEKQPGGFAIQFISGSNE